jgi:hypothetical protein
MVPITIRTIPQQRRSCFNEPTMKYWKTRLLLEPCLLLYLLKSGILEALSPPSPRKGESKELSVALARHLLVDRARRGRDGIRGTDRSRARDVAVSEAILSDVRCGQLMMAELRLSLKFLRISGESVSRMACFLIG